MQGKVYATNPYDAMREKNELTVDVFQSEELQKFHKTGLCKVKDESK